MGVLEGIGAVASLASAREGAGRAASAAGGAAVAQMDEARRQYDETNRITEKPTMEAMLNADTAIKSQERNLSRQEEMIKQIDPAILESASQALKLLRGEESSTLAPLRKQRDMQRQKLLNRLREQLGPGAETSTAGIQALTRFDSETDSLMSTAQQDALKNVTGVGASWRSSSPDLLREAQGLSGLGRGRADLAFDRAKLLSGVGQNMINTAGGQFAGDAIRGQGDAALGRNLFGAFSSGGFSKGLDSFSNMFSSGGGNAPGAGNFGGFGDMLIENSAGSSNKNYGGTV